MSKSIPVILTQGVYADVQIIEALNRYLLQPNQETKRFPGFPAKPYKAAGRRLQAALKDRNVPSEEICEMFEQELNDFKVELAKTKSV